MITDFFSKLSEYAQRVRMTVSIIGLSFATVAFIYGKDLLRGLIGVIVLLFVLIVFIYTHDFKKRRK